MARRRSWLAGRRIVITRRREQAEGLREALRRKGAAVIEFPTIALKPPRSWQAFDRALEHLDDYAWVIFTSANGVEFFFRRLRAKRKKIRPLKRARLAAIGPSTAAALRQRGLRADVVPIEYKAEGLLRALARREKSWQGKRVLLARAAKAREALPRELRRRGARVDVVEAYRTVVPRVSQKRIRRAFGGRKPGKAGKPDAIAFTSSSTVKNFFALLGRRPGRRALAGVAVATIGPVTSRTARALGLRVAAEANPYTVPALVRALQRFFRGQRPVPR
ncbi:uroporphyrinogen-III synthase [Acidobacteriia bacterium AH_259_A11_L15]|nr:uroporphyrinogen-III synthase [Acidobacteriia bacterium AH_259_A11_L15]